MIVPSWWWWPSVVVDGAGGRAGVGDTSHTSISLGHMIRSYTTEPFSKRCAHAAAKHETRALGRAQADRILRVVMRPLVVHSPPSCRAAISGEPSGPRQRRFRYARPALSAHVVAIGRLSGVLPQKISRGPPEARGETSKSTRLDTLWASLSFFFSICLCLSLLCSPLVGSGILVGGAVDWSGRQSAGPLGLSRKMSKRCVAVASPD